MADQPRRPLRGGAGQGPEPAGVPARPDARRSRTPTRSRTGSPRCARRRGSRRASTRRRPSPCRPPRASRSRASRRRQLPDLGAAPDFTNTQDWFNTPGGAPLTLARLRGHVVLVDFWTYTCINCIRTLPFVEGLYKTYHRYGLDIVGVETPEFTFEQEACNVQQAIHSDGTHLPGGPGQPLRHLERLPEPVLAGRVPDRRQGRGPPHAVRRGRLQAGRGGGPRAALRGRRPPAAAADDRHGDHALQVGWARPRPTSTPSARRGSPSRCRPACTLRGHHRPRAQPVRAERHLEGQRQSATAGLGRRLDHRAGPGRPRVPGADLGRQHRPARSGAARRQADLRQQSRRRRPRRLCHRPRPAPVLAGVAARRRSSICSRCSCRAGVSAYDFTFG